jgi:hypothetical protein
MKYLSHYIEQAQTDLFNEAGAFFAFGQKQFDEKVKPGVKYCDLGGNLICPVDKARGLVEGLNAAYKAGIEQDMVENSRKDIILRELANHECWYVGDISEAVDKLKDYGISRDEILTAYKENPPSYW